MGYTLYYSPSTASFVIHWMLIELGVPFEKVLVDIDTGAQKDPAYLALNPAGRVPTLIVDSQPRHECVALATLLAERHPEREWGPLPGDRDRAEYLEWTIFLANSVLPAMRDWFYAGIDGDPSGADAMRAVSRSRIEAAVARLDDHLADGRDFFLSGRLTSLDFLVTMLMRWTRNMARPATNWPNMAGYVKRRRSMSSFIEACRREGISDWLNDSTQSGAE
ncbi:glutathione S-transferase family protein [Pinirhizobacter sp.]|uniref:glutathione S-transferase family protein n=1 Tax=Pinirhizobacter sp. TaxID=2950432 RepID=UPI002F41FC1E